MGIRVIGTGSAVPERVITNDDLAAIMDTSDEWIRTRTGIAERHILSDGESLTDLATAAAERAIEMSGVAPEDIGVVICSTLRGDYLTPGVAALVSNGLSVPSGAVIYDINMACSGFVVALNAAAAHLAAGASKYALVIAAEGLSRLVDWSDRGTSVLVGDGAGAVVVEYGESFLWDFEMRTDSDPSVLHVNRTTDNCPYNTEENDGFMIMAGQEVYKFAVSSVVERVGSILQRNSLTVEDVSKVLLHQANMRINRSAVSKLGGGEDKFPHNMERYGNSSSATVPILFDELARKNTFRCGDKIILCAFGAGMTSAACLVEWGR